jgi:hypothetical protein
MKVEIEKALNRLHYIIEKAPILLTEIGEEHMALKQLPTKWSKKEILGHLIDSATNNHQRFVRGQFETNPEITYDQNKWNEFSFYQEMESQQIIKFWTIYNTQLLEIIKRIPRNSLKNQIKVGDNLLTLEFLIFDYVEHLEHHLKQIIDY